MDKLRSMEVFVAVAEAGGFSRAAEALDISAVMVGKHVRQLEERLGARLIQRSTRRQRLTDAGRLFYEESRRVLEQLRWAELSVERLREEPGGLLRVSAPVTLGGCLIAAHAADFMARHPAVRIELVLSDGLVDLAAEGFDLAIRIGELGQPHLVARPLAPYRMVICASPDYLARHGRPRVPQDLGSHRCLGHLSWNSANAWRLCGTGEEAQWPADAPFASNHGPALRAAALRGAGLVLQPEVLLAEDIAAGRLETVLEAHVPPPRPVHLLYLPDRRPLPKLAGFVAHLRERMPPGP
ncbi:LysR substrate-binding domain-containing protein [Caldimonas tepidiphila]|uniref:LysR substrate-binding domain-containing protein n=1 Tax=Caldimonas tepidiphila TaxID=2315841 RepID=UPI000E5AAF81|nr:LysR substrate-binding domain-containing protein [Caldimonas tepidiphila]